MIVGGGAGSRWCVCASVLLIRLGEIMETYRLSIVIPVYNGEKTVERLVRSLKVHLAGVYQLELVLVNDGSSDNSADVCRRLAAASPETVFINLARNFGEHSTVMAGLKFSSGDCVVIMDDDFQNPPEEVCKLVEELRLGYDVVYSCYETKNHHWFRNLGSRLNNFVATRLLNKPADLYLSSFKAVSRFAVREVVKYQGPYPYVDGLILRSTRRISRVLVRHDARADGRSGYTLRKLVSLYMNMFVNFSVLPLRVASILGLAVSFLGVSLAVVFAVEKVFFPETVSGWTSLIVVVLLLSGVQLFGLGMIGEYLGRLFLMSSAQPQFVVRETVNVSSGTFA